MPIPEIHEGGYHDAMRRLMKRIGRGIRQWLGWGRSLGLLLLVLFVQLRALDPGPLEAMRNRTFDFYQIVQPRKPKVFPVVIVDVDEASLKAYGQWPWPRTLVAELIRNIAKNRAVAVALDMVFAEPDRMSPDNLAKVLVNLDPQTREKLRQSKKNDEILAETMKRFRVVLGQSADTTSTQDKPREGAPETPIATIGGDPSRYLFQTDGRVRNIEVLEDAAAGRGLFTILPESDGIIRRVPIVMQTEGRTVPTLTLDLLRVATGSGAILIRSNDLGIKSVGVSRLAIPTDRHGRFWVHFSPSDPRRYISAKDVLEGNASARRLGGKLVLIGTSAIGLRDLRPTPVDPAMPGVEIHAQVLETIMTKSFLTRPSYALGAEVLLAIGVGLAMIILVPIFGALPVVIFGAIIAASTAGLSWYLYTTAGVLLDVVYPLLSSFIIFLSLFFFNYLREENQRRQVRSAFRQYLSPDLVEQLAEDPDRLVLGGETREVTLLFSDVRNFTATAERYKDDPEGLTSLMNQFLTPLSNAIIEQSGTIDKYMGDAIMALWNAPLDDSRHASNACASALEMHRRLNRVNDDRRKVAAEDGEEFYPLVAGIGINTGVCVVGNMGSDVRFDYSAMGDPVNLASRLEGQTKQLGVAILVGEETAQQAEGFALLEVDIVRVVGKQEPVRVFTLLGDRELADTAGFKSLKEHLAAFLGSYRNADWSAAQNALNAARAVEFSGLPIGRLFDVFEARLKNFQENGTPENWDGVYAATQK